MISFRAATTNATTTTTTTTLVRTFRSLGTAVGVAQSQSRSTARFFRVKTPIDHHQRGEERSRAQFEAIIGSKERKRLDKFAALMVAEAPCAIGYPLDEDTQLRQFYQWYTASGLTGVAMDNVGDPFHDGGHKMQTLEFEREVVRAFGARFGLQDDLWGFVASSGTDGNAHGLYYGRSVLAKTLGGGTGALAPIVYVSTEAHYSVTRLCDVQQLEVRLVNSTEMGSMCANDLRSKLDATRPALIVFAIGTTFKGAIDDQEALNRVLDDVRPPAVYRHCDAALFGSFLAFAPDATSRAIVDARRQRFDSISFSGHKFWGFDEPCGLFLTRASVRAQLNPFHVGYLKDTVPTIGCSRSALSPLKFFWKLKFTPVEAFEAMSVGVLDRARMLHALLVDRGIRAWLNPHSNTVFFERPPQSVMDKYDLAPEESATLGPLAHVIVMQHVVRSTIEQFVDDLVAAKKKGDSEKMK